MVSFESLIPKLLESESVSLIGIHKNVGKTTTLNKILSISRGKIKIGLTSIGRDGEKNDILQNHPKPRIYIERGTILATTDLSLTQSDITPEILESTGILTPLGEIVIIQALSDGYVLLAGPSHTSEIQWICNRLKEYHCNLILVDGAFSRKSLASPSITAATILAVGAAFANDMAKTIEETIFLNQIFDLPLLNDNNILQICQKIPKVGYISAKNEPISFNTLTSLESSDSLIEAAQKNPKYFVIKGVVTDSLLRELIHQLPNLKEIPIIIQDATKLLLSPSIYALFLKAKGTLFTLNPIKLLAITINPWSPNGFDYPSREFLELLQKSVSVPVFNILGK